MIIRDSELRSTNLAEGKRIISFPALDQDASCIAAEDESTHEIDFLAYRLVKDDKGDNKLSLCGLSVEESWDEAEERSSIVKFCSSTVHDEKTDKWTQISLVLRLDGSVEVYVDFILKNRMYDPKQQFIDIGVGNKNFFFKMVKNSHLVTSKTKPSMLLERSGENRHIDVEYWSVLKTWRNRISLSTVEMATKRLDEWNEVLQKRVAPYVKLYTEVANLATFMILAHRNLLSIFDLG